MAEENKDVDLYAELKATLESADEPEAEVKPSGASPEPTPATDPAKEEVKVEPELSEEEISKLTPRAQKRIRDLADKVKELAEKPAEIPEEVIAPEPQEEPKLDNSNFKNVTEFLNAVEDEPSRKLLEKFYGVIKAETSTILAPVERQNNETKFETEFKKYEKIEGLSDYHDDLKKTFLRNPNQSFKALIGETVADLQLNKVKSVEKTPSTPNRGKVDTSNLSKDELYELMDTLKE